MSGNMSHHTKQIAACVHPVLLHGDATHRGGDVHHHGDATHYLDPYLGPLRVHRCTGYLGGGGGGGGGTHGCCFLEPAFVRKRNARERHRVRCVNEGYARLREHLPREPEEQRRLSKVETLRAAAGYIARLQRLLEFGRVHAPPETAGRVFGRDVQNSAPAPASDTAPLHQGAEGEMEE